MNQDQLVEQIVNELCKKLQANYQTTSPKKRALILGHHRLEHQELLEQTYEIISATDTYESVDVVIIPRLDIGLLSQIALGIGEMKEANSVLQCLLRGKTVYVLEQGITYRQYRSTAHRTLFSVYSDYENKIKQYGVRLIHDVVEILTDQRTDYNKVQQREQMVPEVIRSDEGIHLQTKKVILEADLTRAYIQGVVEVVIGKKAIVTPLAEDFIRAHHLTIKRM